MVRAPKFRIDDPVPYSFAGLVIFYVIIIIITTTVVLDGM